jgi:DNA repair protein RecN (Recombination protein N)
LLKRLFHSVIVELTVENIAIIERAQLALGPGFTALTGETGAGKSLFIDALELAFGARADSDLVRTGAPRAQVSVTIDLSQRPDIAAACAEFGAEAEEQLLYLQREVFAEGRSQCRINGRLAPVSTLRALGELLVDLHGQHDHQSLLHSERHLGFLDAWIGLPAAQLKASVGEKLESFRAIERKLNSLRQNRRDREHRIDLLRFQIEEIDALQPVPGELLQLEQQAARLRHAEKLGQFTGQALERLADGEATARDMLAEALRSLDEAERLDDSIGPIGEPLRTALYNLEEGLLALRSYADSVEANPALLDELTERIDGLKRLLRKYGDDEQAVVDHRDRAAEELATLEDGELGEERLQEALDEALASLTAECEALTSLRTEHATNFCQLVEQQLRDLAMERAKFSIRREPKEPESDGADRIEFLFSANTGEILRPLSKIASGGEVSRVMLGIKTVLAGKAGVPTLVFDEVDVGLGGRAAAVVAKKIEELAGFYQVIVISHLPQIASRATTHFHIAKGEQGGRVTTDIRHLNAPERVDEIARMIAGETVTAAARSHAQEMIEGK